jgi:hypothetical protein
MLDTVLGDVLLDRQRPLAEAVSDPPVNGARQLRDVSAQELGVCLRAHAVTLVEVGGDAIESGVQQTSLLA